MEKLGFYLVFAAFLVGAMERHLEARGRNDGSNGANAMIAACFGGVFALMVACSVVLAGGLAVQSTLSTLFGIVCVLILALALNTLAGGAEVLPDMPRRVLAGLERREEPLRRGLFPFAYAIAFVGLAYEAFITFVLH